MTRGCHVSQPHSSIFATMSLRQFDIQTLEYEDASPDEHHEANQKDSDRSTQRRKVVTAEPQSRLYHRAFLSLYSPPRQRQKWGETQVLPRVNWGDLFFDLFYVAATYQVSYIWTSRPDAGGFLYALATFGAVMDIWQQKTYFEARFSHGDDLYHRLQNLGLLGLLATAVVHIRPVKYLSNVAGEVSMFTFCLAILWERTFVLATWLEVYFLGVGQKENIRHVSKNHIVGVLIPTAFYFCAMVLAAHDYFQDDDKHRLLAAEESYDKDEKQVNHIPIILVLTGSLAYLLYTAVVVIFVRPSGGEHRRL